MQETDLLGNMLAGMALLGMVLHFCLVARSLALAFFRRCLWLGGWTAMAVWVSGEALIGLSAAHTCETETAGVASDNAVGKGQRKPVTSRLARVPCIRLRSSGLVALEARRAGRARCCGLAQRRWRRRWVASLPAPRRRYWSKHLVPATTAEVRQPGGLQTLAAVDARNQSIGKVTLQSGPQTFMFGDAFGKSSEKVTLPSGPQIVMFGDASAQSTEKVTLPSGLQTPTVGDPVALTTTLRCAEESLTDEAEESLSVEAEESLAEESAGQPSLTAHAATFAAAAAAAAAAAVTVVTAGAATTAVTVVPVVSAEVPPLPPVPLPVTHGWTVPQIIWTTVPSFLGTFPLFRSLGVLFGHFPTFRMVAFRP